MKLNHLNLVVSDVAKAAAFFETYFGFTCAEIKGGVVAVLNGTDNFIMVLMSNKAGTPVYPEAFHIGFILDSTSEVEGVYEKLKAGNVPIEGKPGKIRDSFGFYFHFETVMIEVGHYL